MHERLADLAQARGGLATVPELRDLGVTRRCLLRLREAGDLVHLRRGVYVLAEVWVEASETERYALRTRAVLRARAGVAASHVSALTLAGLTGLVTTPERIDVVDLSGTTTRVRGRGGLFLHPLPASCEIVRDALGDARVAVTPALVQVSRDDTPLTFAVGLDQALGRGLTETGSVGAALRHEGRRRGWVRQAEGLLAGADPLSPGAEATELRIMLTDMGFRPRLRVPLHAWADGSVLRAEFLIGTSLVVSRTAYAGRERDRLRELGMAVAMVPHGDLGHPDRVAASIAAAMRELDSMRLPRARGA